MGINALIVNNGANFFVSTLFR